MANPAAYCDWICSIHQIIQFDHGAGALHAARVADDLLVRRAPHVAPAGEERVGADEKRIGPLRNKRREDLIGITLRANLMDELFGSFAHRNQ
jgi:hypothetical protein